MNNECKPDSLPQWPGEQVTYGKYLSLWETDIQRVGTEVYLTLRLNKTEIATTASEATSFLLAQMIMGTLGRCVIEPEDGEFFTISWPTFVGSRHDDTPAFIYQFLKEYALISPEHKQEAKEIREWIHTNYPLPF